MIVLLQLLLSCSNTDSTKIPTQDVRFNVNRAEIVRDFMTWYRYTTNNIHLSQDFIALDEDSSEVTKAELLDKLASGKFVAYQPTTKGGMPVYKLYKHNSSNADIETTVRQMALTEQLHYNMEGKQLPAYSFTDLNGKVYNKSATAGKILVIKCWFIRCVACVKEFPELNKLVSTYKNRTDILFVSLAMDSAKDLVPFLKQKQFDYAVVPDKEAYMSESLGITEYPTHLLIDKTGKIIKVVNAIEDLLPFIAKQL
ncbi:MAG TPA: TlpA disulfide reductase family protein [Segetibacter sp.]